MRKLVLRRHLRRLARENSIFDEPLRDGEMFEFVFEGMNAEAHALQGPNVESQEAGDFLGILQKWIDFLIENQDKIRQLIEFFRGLI